MPRLLIHVEGQTEETFVQEILGGHLRSFGFSSVSARLVGNPRMRHQRGGIRSWNSVSNEIARHLKQDAGSVEALIVDYYALPDDWPGRSSAHGIVSPDERAAHVEQALISGISCELGDRFDIRRFQPLVMMHEFEALLFSDPSQFAVSVGRPNLAAKLIEIRNAFVTPEDINDSVETAPSKRIQGLFPEYEKPLYGVIAALEIGLEAMRRECQHFNSWLSQLEAIPVECSYLDTN